MKFVRVPKEKFILRPQTRTHSPAYLRRLADSLLQAQLQAVGITKDGTVIWGNGRVLAARMEPKIVDLWAVVVEEDISEQECLRRQATENFCRNDLSNAEKCKICVNYAHSAPDMALKDIAHDLGVDSSMVTRWMAWEKVIESVRAALAADKITLTALYAISQLPQDQQQTALDAALNGKKPARKTNGVRKSSVKYEMPSGVIITLAGEGDGLSLDEVLEALAELLKAAKRANDEGLDSKTFSAVMRDRARA